MTAPYPVTTRYPSSPITPVGGYYLLSDRLPTMTYSSPDGTVVFNCFGGPAIPDRTIPECVQIQDLKGLIPPWQNIKQKGATQDGETYVTSFYDPIEVDMTVMIRARDPIWLRQILRDWIASWDAKNPGRLSWFTQALGYWWAAVQWNRAPVDPITGGNFLRQKFTWSAIAYNAFWQTYDSTDQFKFQFDSASDNFGYVETPGLGSNWDLEYPISNGFIFANDGIADWSTGPSNTAGEVVCRRHDFTTVGDNQVVATTFNSLHQWGFLAGTYNDIWARMGTIDTPGADGVRLRIGIGTLILSYFTAGVETVMRIWPMLIPPLPHETFTLIAGYEGNTVLGYMDNPRMFVIHRNGIPIAWHIEQGTGSPMGADYRGAGFGMYACTGLGVQAQPATVGSWTADDNTIGTQSGFLTRVNVGDQPMWDRYTLVGPGTFTFADGPGAAASDTVSFGPLLPGQMMQLRTDPRKRGVTDLTATPSSPQQQNLFKAALDDFLSFATANNSGWLAQQIDSIFGIQPPQGNPYSLLQGRFSDNAAIPPKSPGAPAQPYQVAVSIANGNADSAIMVAGTPLRRFPW